eukprot:1139932-Pelagomonas_calceolata.AAC.1
MAAAPPPPYVVSHSRGWPMCRAWTLQDKAGKLRQMDLPGHQSNVLRIQEWKEAQGIVHPRTCGAKSWLGSAPQHQEGICNGGTDSPQKFENNVSMLAGS